MGKLPSFILRSLGNAGSHLSSSRFLLLLLTPLLPPSKS
ncbi:hypothetical protein Goshw_028729 [Gossypium schwendimanii]|uniref:Uncharacterized protein n=1 Tax=Gossypium schwendimanii TaxID=34291 RepID=A0A7J9M8D2_GOSSC|nr:hypothetical protein [Gossypium schwendimanii]